MRQNEPEVRIRLGDPWYTADQFRSQLSTSGRRKVIEDRWRHFGEMIREWKGTRTGGDPRRPLGVLDAGCGDGINLVGMKPLAEQV